MVALHTNISLRIGHYALLKNQLALRSSIESLSWVTDTDYSFTTTELARAQIIQQGGTAMMAQANQQPSMVMSLLR
jgi:flagellin